MVSGLPRLVETSSIIFSLNILSISITTINLAVDRPLQGALCSELMLLSVAFDRCCAGIMRPGLLCTRLQISPRVSEILDGVTSLSVLSLLWLFNSFWGVRSHFLDPSHILLLVKDGRLCAYNSWRWRLQKRFLTVNKKNTRYSS